MENIKQIELYKSRGYTACISEAFGTFAHNIKTIFLHTWLYALVLAVVSSAMVSAATDALTDGISVGNTSFFCVAMLLDICATVALYARASMLVNGKPMRWNTVRMARLALIVIAFYILLGVVLGLIMVLMSSPGKPGAAQASLSATSIVINAVSIVVSLVVLPYLYVFTKYMIEDGTKLSRLLLRSFGKGLRYWGFIFTTLFLTYLCVAVCAVILACPAVIILSARLASINGVVTLGDPSGLPSYFDAMQFGFFALASFIWSYVSIIMLLVCFFMYGSIETRIKEKKTYIDNQKTDKK